MIEETNEILTLDELPGWLHVTRKTIVDRIREREDTPPYFRCGRKILFRKSALMKWIEAQEAKNAVGGEAP